MEEKEEEKEQSIEKETSLDKTEYETIAEYQGAGRNMDPLGRKANLMYDQEYIKERLDSQMNWYDRKASWNQKKYKKTKRLEFILAASIPVIISLSTTGIIENTALFSETTLVENASGQFVEVSTPLMTLATLFQIFAAVAGVILVIFNKLLELEEYYKNWKEYRLTSEELLHEKMLYLTCAEPYDESNAFPMLVEKVENILNKEKQQWRQVSKQKNNELVERALSALQGNQKDPAKAAVVDETHEIK